jgi:hypothetical protein
LQPVTVVISLVTLQPPGALDHQINRGEIGHHVVEVHVQRLLNDLSRDDQLSASGDGCAVGAEGSLILFLANTQAIN